MCKLKECRVLSKGTGLVGSIVGQEVEGELCFRHVDFVDLLHAEKTIKLDLRTINTAARQTEQSGLLDA